MSPHGSTYIATFVTVNAQKQAGDLVLIKSLLDCWVEIH